MVENALHSPLSAARISVSIFIPMLEGQVGPHALFHIFPNLSQLMGHNETIHIKENDLRKIIFWRKNGPQVQNRQVVPCLSLNIRHVPADQNVGHIAVPQLLCSTTLRD